MAGMVFGQTLRNRGVYRNTGTTTFGTIQNYRTGVAGTIINSGSLTVTGTLDNDDGAGALGTIRNYIGGLAAGTLTVTTAFTNEGGSFDNDSLTYVPVLNLGGTITSTGTFDTDAGKVVYTAAGLQSIFATTYGALVAAGSGSKSLPGGTTVVNDSSRIADGSTLTVGANQLDLKGAANVLSPTGVLSAGSGTVRYNGDQNQTMIPGTYGTLTLTGSTGANTKTSAGGISFAAGGALTVDANDTLYVSSGNLDLNTNTPTLTNNEAIKVAGNATFHGGITNAGTFVYVGTGAQTIGAVTYADLLLQNTGAKNFPGGTVAVTGNYSIGGGTGARDYTTNSNTFQFAGTVGTQTISGLSETFHILQFAGGAAKTLGGTGMGAARMDVLGTSGVVTNNVDLVTLTNIGSVSLTIASGVELVNSATKEITMNGDLEIDGILTNAGTISVY
jgi:hypothetical protein